jgi:ribonuclease R
MKYIDLKKLLLDLLAHSDQPLTKNQIARALKIKGDDRTLLKKLILELEEAGHLERGKRRRLQPAAKGLKKGDVFHAVVVSVDDDGQYSAEILETSPSDGQEKIILLPNKRIKDNTFGIGAEVLIRLKHTFEGHWFAQVIKRLEKPSKHHIGLFTPSRNGGGRLSSCHRKDSFVGTTLTPFEAKGLSENDVVVYTVSPLGDVKILQKLGKISDPKIFSLMTIYAYEIPHYFSQEAIKLAESGKVPALGNRADLRDLDLVTIDGEDARDFDDAVWAAPDIDPRNPDGWRIVVAIADVAYYVRPGDALDDEARKRGNSVYFPDRVVPMLPEALSNDLCSLKPHMDRACMAIEMVVSAHGKVKSHRVKRALMRSRARLTYTQVQQAIDGTPDRTTEPLLESVILPLYGAYKSLLKARRHRGTLDLESQERQVLFNGDGHIRKIIPRERYDSHKLIEEFMIAANVAAARTLTVKSWPCLFRIHDMPDSLRVENLRQILKKFRISFTKNHKPDPSHFNHLLNQVAGAPYHRMISDLVLRSQAQARYSPINIGHYGLGLSQYAHFTSPIRRYADLVVHRSLISALGLGDDGLPDRHIKLEKVGDHISATERRAALAERDTLERFVTAYMMPQIGNDFIVIIVGLNRFGLFVSETETGAEGFIPKASFKGDTFQFEEHNHRFIGTRTKKSFQLGDTLQATLIEADATINRLIFHPLVSSEKKGKPLQKIPPKKRREKTSKQREFDVRKANN